MKKISMGLLAVSTLSFSKIDMTSPATGTNVFKIAEIGKIKMTAKIRSDVTPVKYVVFANSNDAFAGAETELTLPDIFLSQSSQQNVIDGTPSKIYVRKVNGSNDDVIDLTTETVLYKLNIDPAFNFTATNVIRDFTNVVGNEFSTTIFTLMSKNEVDKMVSLAGSGIKIVQVQEARKAEIKIGTATDTYWIGGTYIMFNSTKMGELTIANSPASLAGSRLDRAACNRMMNYLATERTGYSNLSFEIKVQG